MGSRVIIGAGEAGVRAAISLRDAGQDKVVLIGAEPLMPYDRPALSKPDSEVGCYRPIAADFTGIDLRHGITVTAIDRTAHELALSDGTRLGYHRLLLATGARPRRLAADPDGRALSLRTLDDANRLYARAAEARRVVIIGAGLIGMELASEFRRLGLDVTVLEAGPRALGRAIPDEIAAALVARHTAEGVRLLTSVAIGQLEKDGVRLADGTLIPADLMVSAIGVLPDTSLAEAAGLEVANGIVVNDRLQTSDPAIYAAGDCASILHPRYGRIRLESWRNASEQGTLAGRNMAGSDEAFSGLPWFWSDQYDLGLQMAGLHDPRRRAIHRQIGPDAVLRFEVDETGALTAATGLGPGHSVARDIKIAEKLIAGTAICPADQLTDPGIPMKSFLKAVQAGSSS